MKLFDSLRYRLVAAGFALSLIVCGIFSFGVFMTFDYAEDLLFDAHIEEDVSTFLAQYAIQPGIAELPCSNFAVHIAVGGDESMLPEYLRGLTPDVDDLYLEGEEHDLQIRSQGGDTLYFIFDESDAEEFEFFLILAIGGIAILIVLAALWLSFLLGNRIIKPLTDLSRQVARLGTGGDAAVKVPLAADPHDEISVLASTINHYHRRISELLRREREFSTDVSHELRTPLMGIQGAAEILEKSAGPGEKTADLLGRIKRCCLQMTTLTEALLFLARDPASFSDLVVPVAVDEVINEQVAAVREITNRKGITVNIETKAESTVNSIPAVINIVLGNILKNAVKYTNRDVINIFVTDHEVVIQDYGPGIDERTQETLFDRFNRGNNRNPDGTGIGLALVRRFCDQYGWAIDFRSVEDEGTRVAVAF